MHRREYLAGVGAAAVIGSAGCLDVLALNDYDVGMTPTAFTPEEYVTDVGTTVIWRNTSSRGHTVTAYEALIPDEAAYFASGGFADEQSARDAWDTLGERGMLSTGEEFAYTPTVPGTYHYVCLPHEGSSMVGSVVVRE